MTDVSNYARGILARGPEIAAGEERRLRTTIARTRTAVNPESKVAGLLAIEHVLPASEGPTTGSMLDALSRIVVIAQRAVDPWSKASVHLFLPHDQHERWRSYAHYRQHCDDFFERTTNGRPAA